MLFRSVPAPEWLTDAYQIHITKVVDLRGYKELSLTCPAVLKDGKIYSTSPPFEGIYSSGTEIITTTYDPETGVGYAMLDVWTYDPVGYIYGEYGWGVVAPKRVKRSFPITVPVNKTFDIVLSDIDGTPLVTVSIQGPPARGEFIDGIIKLKIGRASCRERG